MTGVSNAGQRQHFKQALLRSVSSLAIVRSFIGDNGGIPMNWAKPAPAETVPQAMADSINKALEIAGKLTGGEFQPDQIIVV